MHPQERDAIIERCKQEIACRAEYMGLKYDKSEIIAVDCGAELGDCVFLRQYIWTPRLDIEGNYILDENGQPIMIKMPTIWAEYPPMGLAKHRTWMEGESFMTELSVPLPRVHVHYPNLVFLVHADGTVKDGAVVPDGIIFDLQPMN